jgi:23S rRNA pseudouridine2605 synthase
MPRPPSRSPNSAPDGQPALQRLQKIIAAAGVSSRRHAEDLLRAGRVTVNGEVATLGASADPVHDVVAVDGVPLERQPLRYWMLNKPRGVITTVHDPEERQTVLDFIPDQRLRLFPVGRLDRETEGLVLLTNDGALAQKILHPSYETEREYRVTARGRVTAGDLQRLSEGIELEDGLTAPASAGSARYDAKVDATRFTLTLVEGRKRQIRRALEVLGHPVMRLLRVRMGSLELGRLRKGEARELSPRERRALLRIRDEKGAKDA